MTNLPGDLPAPPEPGVDLSEPDVPLSEPDAAMSEPSAAHTTREIAQQPALWREVARQAVRARSEVDAFLRPLLARPDLRLVLTGAGTSAFAGQVLAPVLSTQLARRVEAIATTDIVASPRESFPADVPTLLVSFARSGDSPESVAATEIAELCLTEVHHLVVTCNTGGLLARRHDGAPRSQVLLLPPAANDQGFAMTSSFTGMTLATLLAFSDPQDVDMVESLARAAEHLLAHREADVQKLAACDYQRIVYLGSGALKGLARESALKVLELTAGGIAAFSDTPLGFRHGPKSILNDRTLVVVYLSNDPHTRLYDLDLLAELRSTQGDHDVLAITAAKGDTPTDDSTWELPGLGHLNDAALALPAMVFAQLFGLHASLRGGHTPDNPFPAGEVNRVVQGVTLHLPS